MKQIEAFTKNNVKKILFISLFFSAAVPSVMQANLLNWATLRSGAKKVVSLLTKYKIAVIGTAVGIVGVAFVWKVLTVKEGCPKRVESLFFYLFFIWHATKLMIVSRKGDLKSVKSLLKERDDVDEQNECGWTALMIAAEYGHLEVVKLFLERGADVDKQCYWNKKTALRRAAEYGHLEVVKLLLEKRAVVDRQCFWNETALMGAVGGGHSRVVKLLLESRADANKQCNWDEKALRRAARTGKECDGNKTTALIRAAKLYKESTGPEKQKYRDIIGKLLAADVDQQVKCKTTGRLEQIDLKEYLQDMQKQTFRILKEETLQLSSKLPNDIATLISGYTY